MKAQGRSLRPPLPVPPSCVHRRPPCPSPLCACGAPSLRWGERLGCARGSSLRAAPPHGGGGGAQGMCPGDFVPTTRSVEMLKSSPPPSAPHAPPVWFPRGKFVSLRSMKYATKLLRRLANSTPRAAADAAPAPVVPPVVGKKKKKKTERPVAGQEATK